MAKVYVFLADGFEDVEALIPVDVLRRGGQDVVTVSVMDDSQTVESAHGVTMIADTWIGDCDLTDADLLLLPGGMPGASNLYACEPLRQALVNQQEEGKLIAAICASPAVVLGQMGLLQGYRATCYPGFEQLLSGAEYTGELCTVDGNIITGEGPAAAFPFAYALLAILQDEATAQQIADGMRYTHLMAEGR
ncbi:MAG: DJ-1/PfpI family protein [Prevotella sp.]|nr:DJ-1/PfpI family protein [Prevotella sp.]